ncbi:MAG: DUF4340 domain-containing protein [bacterium]
MKNYRPFIYLAVVIALAFVVLLIERPETPRVNDVGQSTFSPGFDSARVMRVEVSQLLDGAVLKREGNRWLVSSYVTPLRKQLLKKEGKEPPPERWYRADSTRIASALGNFGGLGEGLVVSSNSEKRSLYQVESTGLSVRLIGADEKPIVDVIIGKNGPDLASSYIRRASEDAVYIVRRPIAGAFTPRASDWRDRKVWLFEPKELKSIKVESPKGAWRIARGEGGGWQVKEPTEGPQDDSKALDAARRLSVVNATGFPEDADALSLLSPEITLTITDIVGKSFSLDIFGATADGRFPARIKGDDEVFLFKKEFVEGIPLSAP